MSHNLRMRWAIVYIGLFYPTMELPALCGEVNSKDRNWKISVSANKDDLGEWQLDVIIEYHGQKPVDVPDGVIPWKWPYAMNVCAVPEQEFLVRPFSPKKLAVERPQGTTKVRPGDTLKGTIPLRSLFDSNVLKPVKGPMVVFWSYKPQASDRVGGWIEIPGEKNRKKDGSDREEWKLNVSMEKSGSEVGKLKIEIEYLGEKDTALERFALPWKWPESMMRIAVSADGQSPEPLLPLEAFGDPPMSFMPVKPGDIINGEVVPLAGLQDKIRDSNRLPLIVFWSYKIKSSNRVGGWFEIGNISDVGNDKTRE